MSILPLPAPEIELTLHIEVISNDFRAISEHFCDVFLYFFRPHISDQRDEKIKKAIKELED